MRTSQIEALIAVAEEGGFSAAAARLGVSQSSLSRSVAALEREVGTLLLRRHGSPPVVPTESGEAFLAAAPVVLAAVASARAAAGGCR